MSLEDLVNNTSVSGTPDTENKVSNLIDPTQEMVDEVISLFIAGEDIKTIKKTVKLAGTNKTLSFLQVKSIIDLYRAKVASESEPIIEE